MRYYKAKFHITPDSQDARDLLAAVAAEAGFESFDDEGEALAGYVQTELFDQPCLDESLQSFPLPHVAITYDLSEMEDKNWNETWEQQGFEPIVIGDECIIYDAKCSLTRCEVRDAGCEVRGTRCEDSSTDNDSVADSSLEPQTSQATEQSSHLAPRTSHLAPRTSHLEAPLQIAIDARQAFGTGTHETTQMIVGTLLHLDLHGKRVLDCGCGTGILGIVAAKRGAAEVVGYDIDDWSVRNTQHNAELNDVEIEVLEGDKRVLSHVNGVFDVVMANINRNILLADMEAFEEVMNHPATLILSGFYEEDAPVLLQKAAELGLKEQQRKVTGSWCCLVFCRQ